MQLGWQHRAAGRQAGTSQPLVHCPCCCCAADFGVHSQGTVLSHLPLQQHDAGLPGRGAGNKHTRGAGCAAQQGGQSQLAAALRVGHGRPSWLPYPPARRPPASLGFISDAPACWQGVPCLTPARLVPPADFKCWPSGQGPAAASHMRWQRSPCNCGSLPAHAAPSHAAATRGWRRHSGPTIGLLSTVCAQG